MKRILDKMDLNTMERWVLGVSDRKQYRKELVQAALGTRHHVIMQYIRLYTNLILAVNELKFNGERAGQYTKQVINYSRKSGSEERQYLREINELSKQVYADLKKIKYLDELAFEKRQHLKFRLIMAQNICLLRLLNI